MKVYLLQNVEKIGLAGEIVNVSDGLARNKLIPRKLGIEVTKANEASFAHKVRTIEHRKEVIESQTSMLAEKIKNMRLKLKRKLHDDGKLYGAISAHEIADELSKHGVNIGKNKVLINKSIKAKGQYKVTIKLTSTLMPEVTVDVVGE